VDGEAVGELAGIVGENGVNRVREVSEEAVEEGRRGLGIAPQMNLHIDVACGAIDGDEGVALAPLQGGQMLDVHVDEADACLFEYADRRLVRLWSSFEAVA